MLEDNWNKYLEKYENYYNLHIEKAEKKIPNLMKLLERFNDEMYIPTKIYKLMVQVKEKIEEELNLNDEQEKLFEYWTVCEDNILNDIVEQAFIYGYSLAMGLKEESKYILDKNLKE